MQVLYAMIKTLKKGGYISLPCENSINFPKRKGTLNFYDDKTHQNIIPYDFIIQTLKKSDFNIVFARKRYRLFFLFLTGLLYEPFSYLFKKVGCFGITWALYGFETIVITKKQLI
jgi:hypothetical protein